MRSELKRARSPATDYYNEWSQKCRHREVTWYDAEDGGPSFNYSECGLPFMPAHATDKKFWQNRIKQLRALAKSPPRVTEVNP